MQELVALFAPALMALGFFSHLHRDKLSTRRLVFSYGVFALFINLCSYMVVVLVLGKDIEAIQNRMFIIYSLISAAFAFVLPFVVNLIENTISIDVRKNRKNR